VRGALVTEYKRTFILRGKSDTHEYSTKKTKIDKERFIYFKRRKETARIRDSQSTSTNLIKAFPINYEVKKKKKKKKKLGCMQFQGIITVLLGVLLYYLFIIIYLFTKSLTYFFVFPIDYR
jgi:hypothetical protein